MSKTFKILSRDKKTNRQIKKRTYTSLDSFKKYGPDIIKRYGKVYNVECYQLLNDEWLLLDGVKHISEPKEKIVTLYFQDFVSESVFEEICDQLGIEYLKTDKIDIKVLSFEVNQ